MLKLVSFGKTLVANCQLKMSSDRVSSCKIFELEKSDSDYFKKVKTDSNWFGNKFLWIMNEQTKPNRFGDDTQIFVLEDDSSNCLGYINIISRDNKLIQYLEIMPIISNLKNKNYAQNIARALVSTTVKSAQKEDKEKVSALAFDFTTRKFYTKKCGFKSGMQSAYDYVIDKKNYSRFFERFVNRGDVNIDFKI